MNDKKDIFFMALWSKKIPLIAWMLVD